MIAGFALVGCGSNRATAHTFSGADVERAFRAEGVSLRPETSNGAEQPAMGETSPCATRYLGTTRQGSIVVTVCDDAHAAAGVPDAHVFRLTRANVVADYSGTDSRIRARVRRALHDLG